MNTKISFLALIMAFAFMSPIANAAGCLKGAAVGGVAGHVAGKHGVAGAAVGCAVGHHRAAKAAKQQQATQANPAASSATPNQ